MSAPLLLRGLKSIKQRRLGSYRFIDIAILAWTLGIVPAAFSYDDNPHISLPLTETEQWVLERIKSGEDANLKAKYPETENARVVSTKFIERLLTNTFPGEHLTQAGIHISGAVFNDSMSLNYAVVECELLLSDCKFLQTVSFNNTRFARTVSFAMTEFYQDANFGDAKFEDTISLSGAIFDKYVTFSAAVIASNLEACDAQFKNATQQANFSRVKVGGYACFARSIFLGSVNFGGAAITDTFDIGDSKHWNDSARSDFSRIRVGGAFTLSRATFDGPVDFSEARLLGRFDATEVRFKGKKNWISFDAIKIESDINLNQETLFEIKEGLDKGHPVRLLFSVGGGGAGVYAQVL